MKYGILSSSPDKNKSTIKRYRDKIDMNENDKASIDMLDWILDQDLQKKERENDPNWQKNNLEYDLRSTEWILEKVRNDEAYAQNLYAALCNNSFLKKDTYTILKDEQWSFSWRYAGGIIADMCGNGDYMSWYCSGIRGEPLDENSDEYTKLTEEQKEYYKICKRFVPESVVTLQIKNDLDKLGWIVIQEDD